MRFLALLLMTGCASTCPPLPEVPDSIEGKKQWMENVVILYSECARIGGR